MEIVLKTEKEKMNSSSMGFSRYHSNKKAQSKLSMYETNLDNYNAYTETNKFGG